MIKYYFLLFTVVGLFSTAQVGVNTDNPDPSSILDLDTTTGGFLLPRLTTLQVDAINQPATGLMVFNSTLSCVYVNVGTRIAPDWECVITRDATAGPGEVVGANGRIWMDRNLGATRVAQSQNDFEAYGDLQQWGRLSDGHEEITWTSGTSGTPVQGTTSNQSSTDVPPNSLFIIEPSNQRTGDWRNPQNDTLWQGVNGTNNPCPTGFRIPTVGEWTTERNSWISDDPAGAFASTLKIPLAGVRDRSGNLIQVGSGAYMWASNAISGQSSRISISPTVNNDLPVSRVFGFSVRCIKD